MKKKLVVSNFVTWHELDDTKRELAKPLIVDLVNNLEINGFGWNRQFLAETKAIEVFEQCYAEVYGFDKRVTQIHKLNWGE